LKSKSSNRAIRERLKQARETLEEAEALYQQDFWRGTINRSYYAMFYAVLALAASKEIVISKHTQAVSFLDKEFVKKASSQKKSRARFITVLMNDKPMTMGKSGI